MDCRFFPGDTTIPFFTRALLAATLLFASLSSFAPGTVQASSTPVLDHIRDTGAVRVTYREGSVPFSFYDVDRGPTDYAMDLCLRVVDKLRTDPKRPDLEVQYVMVTPSTRMLIVIEDKADLECSPTTNNRERQEKVIFTIPHYIADIHMLVKTSSDIHKWDDPRDKTVVITKGTTSVVELCEMNNVRVLNMNFLGAKDHAESFTMVETGEADAFVVGDMLPYDFRTNIKTPGDCAVVGGILTIGPYAVMLSKDDIEFKRLMDRAVTNIIPGYNAEKLYEEWFQQPIPPHSAKLGIPMGFLLRDSFKYPGDKVVD